LPHRHFIFHGNFLYFSGFLYGKFYIFCNQKSFWCSFFSSAGGYFTCLRS
jgi:hypothetical protein